MSGPNTRQQPQQGVQIHLRWLVLLASMIVLVLLRRHRVLLTIYVALFCTGSLLYLLWLPKFMASQERKFTREALRLITSGDISGLKALAQRQGLIRRFGRRHVIPDTLAMGAASVGDHEAACHLYAEALQHAPPEDRVRIELNLAAEEVQTGRLDAAEGRYRAILRKRPGQLIAVGQLGRLLVKKEAFSEAIDHLKQALEMANGSEAAGLKLALAEALILTGDASGQALAQEAGSEGASSEEVSRVLALSSSQRDTRG
ncbi:MAG: hypothetical protein ACE366_10505 [Bradymonadia bacterium]